MLEWTSCFLLTRMAMICCAAMERAMAWASASPTATSVWGAVVAVRLLMVGASGCAMTGIGAGVGFGLTVGVEIVVEVRVLMVVEVRVEKEFWMMTGMEVGMMVGMGAV